MEEHKAIEDIKTIRNYIESSNRYLSLSGMSGVLAGIYALAGGVMGYWLLPTEGRSIFMDTALSNNSVLANYARIAGAVLLLSVITAFMYTRYKALSKNLPLWNKVASRMFFEMFMVLAPAGAVMCVLVSNGMIGWLVPLALIFYGISLVVGSRYGKSELFHLGAIEVSLGLINLFMPQFSLEFWCLGFGIMHIAYGWILYNKYDRT